jgi:hypothetical protein
MCIGSAANLALPDIDAIEVGRLNGIPAPLWQSNWMVVRFAAQPHYHIDAGDLVTVWRHGSFAHDDIGWGDIHKLVPILDVEVMMFGIVGVKIGLRCVDCDLSEKADFGELVQGIVDRGKRHGYLSLVRFLKKHFRRYMTITFGEQKGAKGNARSCRTESDFT